MGVRYQTKRSALWPELPPNPQGKDIDVMILEDEHLILESDNRKSVVCTLTWLNTLNKDIQKKILTHRREQA